MEKLGVDIDNVVAQTDPKIRELLYRECGKKFTQAHITEFDYAKATGLTEDQIRSVMEKFHRTEVAKLGLIPGAVEALSRLSDSFEVALVTSRPEYTRSSTVKWLSDNGVSYQHLLYSDRKHETDVFFHCFVEDNPEQAVALARVGTRVFLMDYPWNRGVANQGLIERVEGWDQISKKLEIRKGAV